MDGDKPVAAGGIRILGIGEAWLLASPEFVHADTKVLLRYAIAFLKHAIMKNNLWEVFAMRKGQNVFLEHMDFHPIGDMYVRKGVV
jgi:hypothetical protein